LSPESHADLGIGQRNLKRTAKFKGAGKIRGVQRVAWGHIRNPVANVFFLSGVPKPSLATRLKT
jgi:hypothetical protein